MQPTPKPSVLKQCPVTYSASSQTPEQRYIDAEIEALGGSAHCRIKLTSPVGETKWISATREQVQRIREILKEPKQ